MGDSHRPSLLNLLAKQRNHRPVAAQHVAKSRGDELRGHAPARRVEEERLAVNLGHTLGASHHVGGIDGLVGRDHNKLVDAILEGEVGNVARAQDIG